MSDSYCREGPQGMGGIPDSESTMPRGRGREIANLLVKEDIRILCVLVVCDAAGDFDEGCSIPICALIAAIFCIEIPCRCDSAIVFIKAFSLKVSSNTT